MTQTWLAADFTCPDADGMFDPGTDTDILLINQNLDFTTDVSTSSWSDIDGDGDASLAGAGPAAGFSRTGVCIDIGAQHRHHGGDRDDRLRWRAALRPHLRDPAAEHDQWTDRVRWCDVRLAAGRQLHGHGHALHPVSA